MEGQAGLGACEGCGAMVPEFEGPTHRYIGASPTEEPVAHTPNG